MKIAIIGSGIAGNVAAYHLCREHEITVYEANEHIGGHTHTHDIVWRDRHYAVDTGFIVFNYRTYPQFTRLLRELDVEVQPSSMSFSVKCEKTGLEYNGTSINSLFAQRRNILRPAFYRLLWDILRFNREAPLLLESNWNPTLDEYLRLGKYTREFSEQYLIPMGAAIWSAEPNSMYGFPAKFFIRFFHNHGMLSVDARPTWHVIKGGSQNYVRKLIHPFAHRIRTNCKVEAVRRFKNHVGIKACGREPENYDAVFFACHSDQALRLLQDPSREEQDVLGAIHYQENEAVLHTDASVLPSRRLAWAAWNYHILARDQQRVALSYNMNILQSLQAPMQFCVTLNNDQAIDPRTIIKRITYHHPVFTPEALAAQACQSQINGIHRSYYCGAYWHFGFHEDGVVSALNALQHFKERQDAQLPLPRAS